MKELFRRARRPWCIAHRGDSHACPENTRASFDAAITTGIDGIELDLQLSRDGVPVVFHDRTLKKAGGGRRGVAGLDLSDLRSLDAGSWFDPSFAGERIPTLDEVLSRYARRSRLLLEVKARDGDDAGERHRELAERTVEAVGRHGVADQVAVLSFDPEVLEIVRHARPALPVARNLGELPRLTAAARADLDGLAAVCVDIRALNARFVQEMHSMGKPVLTYTCNGPRAVARALRAGADGILSDRPAWLLGNLDRRRRGPGAA